jgi:hypothetical protein
MPKNIKILLGEKATCYLHRKSLNEEIKLILDGGVNLIFLAIGQIFVRKGFLGVIL